MLDLVIFNKSSINIIQHCLKSQGQTQNKLVKLNHMPCMNYKIQNANLQKSVLFCYLALRLKLLRRESDYFLSTKYTVIYSISVLGMCTEILIHPETHINYNLSFIFSNLKSMCSTVNLNYSYSYTGDT